MSIYLAISFKSMAKFIKVKQRNLQLPTAVIPMSNNISLSWEKNMASTQTAAQNIQQYLTGQQDQNNVTKVLSTIKGETNVSTPERWLTGIAGGALTTYGIMRRDWLGTTLAVLGGYAVVRGLTGHCYVYQTLGVNM